MLNFSNHPYHFEGFMFIHIKKKNTFHKILRAFTKAEKEKLNTH